MEETMQIINNVSMVILLLAVILTIFVWFDLKKHPQPMKIMDVVWPLTVLWSSFIGFIAYLSFGRTKGKQSTTMDMSGMKMDMSGKKNDMPAGRWYVR